jgi:3'-phosphoadenosine 5'-phosphosulfate sulfotransferase (PAPS reductase)/FAD synthetase
VQNPTEKNKNVRNTALTGITTKGLQNRNFVIPKKWQYLKDAPFKITAKCCYYLKKKPLYPYRKNGMFIGTKATDSRLRMINYQTTGCINESKNTCTPLSIWTKEDVWNYIRQNNLPYSEIYNKGEVSTGCAYCAFGIMFDKNRFKRLQKLEPKRYEIMMNIKNNGVTYKEAIQIIKNEHLYKTLFDI